MKSASEYRRVGRESLNGNWGNAILVNLIILAITAVLSAGSLIVVGAIGLLLLEGQLSVGQYLFNSKLINTKSANVNDMFEDFGKNMISNCITHLLMSVYLALWTLLFIIPGIIKSYSYSMTMFIKSKNPTMSSNEAITLSRQIMNGKKFKLFCLQLSFIGWALLCLFTFGIGYLFLSPYISISTTAFYEDAYLEYKGFSATVIENKNQDTQNV